MATKKTKKTTSRRSTRSIVTDEMVRNPWFWVILVVCLVAYFIINRVADSEEQKPKKIEATATQISSFKEIAEWEFLTLQMEEVADTTIPRKILSDPRCIKIYHGTAHLGINMKKAKKSWIECRSDSAILSLPAISLLDKDIIDDTATETFYEDGKVSATVKETMYQNAKKQMKQRILTDENIKMAEESAVNTFKSIFLALGYKTVLISFNNDK